MFLVVYKTNFFFYFILTYIIQVFGYPSILEFFEDYLRNKINIQDKKIKQ